MLIHRVVRNATMHLVAALRRATEDVVLEIIDILREAQTATDNNNSIKSRDDYTTGHEPVGPAMGPIESAQRGLIVFDSLFGEQGLIVYRRCFHNCSIHSIRFTSPGNVRGYPG